MDYQGNEELLLAFERLLERRKDLHGQVVLMLACVAAASGMKIYETPNAQSRRWPDASTAASARSIGCPSAFTRRIDEMIAWFCHADVCTDPPAAGWPESGGQGVRRCSTQPWRRSCALEFTGASVVLDGAVLTNPYSNRRMDEAIQSHGRWMKTSSATA